MNTKNFVREISKSTGFTQKDVQTVIDAGIDVIKNTVANEEISLVGFGKFITSDRAERVMRNPATGGQVTVPAKKSLKFKPAKAFKDAVNS